MCDGGNIMIEESKCQDCKVLASKNSIKAYGIQKCSDHRQEEEQDE